MLEFSDPIVCTITATVTLGTRVNIVDTAKYAEPMDDILAIRISYAGGRSMIMKGIPPKKQRGTVKKRCFNNQVSFIVKLQSGEGHSCCKVFHNGTVHITGARSQADLDKSLVTVRSALLAITGEMQVTIVPALVEGSNVILGTDHVLYHQDGRIIGWGSWEEDLFYLTDVGFVELEMIDKLWTFVRTEWAGGIKPIYSTGGERLGQKTMKFFPGAGRRYYTIKNDEICVGNVLVGRVVADIKTEGSTPITPVGNTLTRKYASLEDSGSPHSSFSIHMVNAYFKSSMAIDRIKLHSAFLSDGFYSRFDPCVNPGVNLRFYDNMGQVKFGVCECSAMCNCKKVSVRCFTSGSLIVAGLRDIDHVFTLHEFMRRYYEQNHHRIV